MNAELLSVSDAGAFTFAIVACVAVGVYALVVVGLLVGEAERK